MASTSGPERRSGRLARAAGAGAVVVVFAGLFLSGSPAELTARFERFRVPTMAYPGDDARNIQIAAHCARQGYPYFGTHACLEASTPVRDLHPEIRVPVLNYPSIWPRAYGLFGDDGERFFMGYWRLNALLLVAAIMALAWRHGMAAAPLVLFSPVALLAVERGNNDAATLFVTFVPLLLARGDAARALWLGVAGALKIFPLVALLALVRRRWPPVGKAAVVGGLCAAPLVAWSLLELPHLLAGTGRAFMIAYGLPSLRRAPIVEDSVAAGWMLTALVLLALGIAITGALRKGPARAALEADLAALAPQDRMVLVASLAIFFATFLLFTNWAYRLLFLVPAGMVLARVAGRAARAAALGVLLLLWIPWLPGGWLLLNFACYPLALALAGPFTVALTLQAPTPETANSALPPRPG